MRRYREEQKKTIEHADLKINAPLILTCINVNEEVDFYAYNLLSMYAACIGAQIIVGIVGVVDKKNKYKIPTNCIIANKRMSAGNIAILGDEYVKSYRIDPCLGIERIHADENIKIVFHKHQALRSLPRLHDAPYKLIYSTGCMNVHGSTYSTLGALVVDEFPDGALDIRQIQIKNGTIFDKDISVSEVGISDGNSAEAIILGDVHFPNQAKYFYDNCYHLQQTFHPKRVILHDVYDFNVQNHHRMNDMYHQMVVDGQKVQEEFTKCLEAVNNTQRIFMNGAVQFVQSNHENALWKWLDRSWTEPMKNFVRPCDVEFYSKLLYASINLQVRTFGGLIQAYGAQLENEYETLDENATVCGITVGMHGHLGTNGARGTLKGLSRVSESCVTGHSHTPAIFRGHYSVGTSTPLKLNYNASGPTTWCNAHCVIYPNGARTLLIYDERKPYIIGAKKAGA